MSWPTSNVSTSGLDSGSDSLADARLNLKDAVDALNTIIDARGSASGIPALDADGIVSEPSHRTKITPVSKTANYLYVASDNARIFICDANTTQSLDPNAEIGWHVYLKNGDLGVTDGVVTVSTGDSNVIFEGGDTSMELRPGDGAWFLKTATSKFHIIGNYREYVIGGTQFRPRRFAYFNNTIVESASSWATVDADVTEATWESVGPTGSGADNIWTALDSIPSVEGFINLQVFLQVSTVGATVDQGLLRIKARRFADTTGGTTVAELQCATTSAIFGTQIVNIVLPIDSSGRFKIYWEDGANTATNTIRLELLGFWT